VTILIPPGRPETRSTACTSSAVTASAETLVVTPEPSAFTATEVIPNWVTRLESAMIRSAADCISERSHLAPSMTSTVNPGRSFCTNARTSVGIRPFHQATSEPEVSSIFIPDSPAEHPHARNWSAIAANCSLVRVEPVTDADGGTTLGTIGGVVAGALRGESGKRLGTPSEVMAHPVRSTAPVNPTVPRVTARKANQVAFGGAGLRRLKGNPPRLQNDTDRNVPRVHRARRHDAWVNGSARHTPLTSPVDSACHDPAGSRSCPGPPAVPSGGQPPGEGLDVDVETPAQPRDRCGVVNDRAATRSRSSPIIADRLTSLIARPTFHCNGCVTVIGALIDLPYSGGGSGGIKQLGVN